MARNWFHYFTIMRTCGISPILHPWGLHACDHWILIIGAQMNQEGAPMQDEGEAGGQRRKRSSLINANSNSFTPPSTPYVYCLENITGKWRH